MVLRSAGRGRALGNSASAENWSTSERMVSTDDDDDFGGAADDGGRGRLELRSVEQGAEAVDVALDQFGVERDGGERVLDLVGDAAGDFFPGALFLRAEEFGGVFEDEDVAEMLAAMPERAWRATFEQGDGGGELQRCRRWRGAVCISAEAEPMRWRGAGGGRAASMISGGKTASRARPMNGRWPPGSSISEKARLASTMRRSAESVTTPLGMVSMMVSSSVRRAWRAVLASESCAVERSATARGGLRGRRPWR